MARKSWTPADDVIVYPDPRLRHVALEVTEADDVADLVAALHRVREKHGGVGLAATQLGVRARVFVLRGWPEPFINPEIVGHGEVRSPAVEGCLSLPGLRVQVSRWRKIKLRALDSSGCARTFKLRDLDARAAQHELDHLDGVLIFDLGAVAA